MNSFGSILAKYRKAQHISQPDLAELLKEQGVNVSQKTLSSWESSRTEPPIKALFTLCRILNIEDIYEELYGINPYNRFSRFNELGKEKINDYMNLLEAAGGYMKEQASVLSFPEKVIRLFHLPVSAGTGQFLDGEDYEEITLDASYSADIDFAVHVRGDSMMPRYEDGQVIYVHRQDTLNNGEIGIFLLDGNAYVKKLQKTKKGIALLSLNKKYEPIPVKEFDDLFILGKVVD